MQEWVQPPRVWVAAPVTSVAEAWTLGKDRLPDANRVSDLLEAFDELFATGEEHAKALEATRKKVAAKRSKLEASRARPGGSCERMGARLAQVRGGGA